MRRWLLPLAALAALSCTPGARRAETPLAVGTLRASLVAPHQEVPQASKAGSIASGAHELDDDLEGPEDGSGHDHDHEHGAPPSEGDLLPEELALEELPSEAQVKQLVATDLTALGSLSLGKPNAGALINAVQMPEGDRWEIVSPLRAWGTQETIDALITAIDAVHERFPGAHKLSIGHLSRESGGRLYPHRSHQSGRDVDIGYYYVPEKAEWYRPATPQTLDLDRSWALVRSFVVDTDVEMIFIDRSVQKLLKEHALALGEDPGWLDSVFQYKSRHPEPIVRHTWGHKTHIHVRFFNPRAQRLGVRAFGALVSRKVIKPQRYLVPYKARGGDTLAGLAQKGGSSLATIQKVNGIETLSPGQTVFVPMRGHVAEVPDFELPQRRLPPRGPDPQKAPGAKKVVAGPSE